jgi:hypothetical protein
MSSSPNHLPIDPARCSAILESLLLGAWILRIEYVRTCWTIDFCVPETSKLVRGGLIAHPFEVTLDAVELRSVLDVSEKEADDTLTAMALFSSVPHTLIGVNVTPESSLLLKFEGGQAVIARGVCHPHDEVWTLWSTNGQRRRAFGEPSFVQSYFGELGIDPRLL